ncbi:MAG: hypothetical protein MK554_04465 [Planctomycetes bacterium]|nr:hypothetical protein [Planctomycetota bacterium]
MSTWTWLIFALGTVCCWGAYGTAVHTSNALLGNPLKTALLVGIAYFFIAVLVPGLILKSKGADWSFINPAGSEPVAGKETGKAEQDSSKPALQEEGEAKQDSSPSKFIFPRGTWFGLLTGTLGALGAICVIYSMKSGGSPLYVMPIIFGCAPLVNVIVSSVAHPPEKAINPVFWLGVLVLASGAGMVLYFQPK